MAPAWFTTCPHSNVVGLDPLSTFELAGRHAISGTVPEYLDGERLLSQFRVSGGCELGVAHQTS